MAPGPQVEVNVGRSISLLLLVIVGCDPAATPADAGSVRDTGSIDAGIRPDGATPDDDGGGGTDGGDRPDGGGDPTDGGSGLDASAPRTPGCFRSGEPVGLQPGITFIASGGSRLYTLSVPSDYTPSRAYPVVFGFHGDGGRGDTVRGPLGIETAAGAGAAIFVYPDATVASGRSWDLESARDLNDDIAFVRELLDDVADRYCVDLGAVFAAGHSRGGFFTNILNCRLGTTTFRAVGPMAGSIYSTATDGYTSDGHVVCEAEPAPVLEIHGDPDPNVPTADGLYARDQWVWAHGCGTAGAPVAPSPCEEYPSCTSGGRVIWCQVPGIGHSVWSMAGPAIWTFFDSYL